jgi:hypothetical protein
MLEALVYSPRCTAWSDQNRTNGFWLTNSIGCAARRPQDVFERSALPEAVDEQIDVGFGEVIESCAISNTELT